MKKHERNPKGNMGVEKEALMLKFEKLCTTK
jgi:hypothetical protein